MACARSGDSCCVKARDFDFREMAAGIIEHQPSLAHVIVDGEPGPFKALSALDAPCPADPLADPRGMALTNSRV
ncbi:hypothetical protein ALO81_04993, partial [Pseudomonas cannabina]